MNKTLMMMVTAGMLLVVIGMILSIGAKIQTTTKENVATTTSSTYNNDSTVTDGTYVSLDCTGDTDSPANVAISNVFNGSIIPNTEVCGGAATPACPNGNYTLDATTGAINFTVDAATGLGGNEFTGNNFTVTYTCTGYGLVWSIGVNGTESLVNLSTWNGTIAVIIAAIVVITLLMAGFGAWLFMRKD